MPSRPASPRALHLRGFRSACPRTIPVSSSCPEAESPPWAEEPQAARCPLIPWHRRPWVTSAPQPGRAPQPTPLDWTAGSVSAPSGCRLQSAGVFPPGPRVAQERALTGQLAGRPQASEQVVRPTSAHPIQRVHPPGAASEEVRVTCGSMPRIHDVSALRYVVTLRGHSHPRLDVVAISPCVGQGV